MNKNIKKSNRKLRDKPHQQTIRDGRETVSNEDKVKEMETSVKVNVNSKNNKILGQKKISENLGCYEKTKSIIQM